MVVQLCAKNHEILKIIDQLTDHLTNYRLFKPKNRLSTKSQCYRVQWPTCTASKIIWDPWAFKNGPSIHEIATSG